MIRKQYITILFSNSDNFVLSGALDQVKESFFFHSFMNQDPSDDLLDLPQEPQVGKLHCIK